MSGSVTIAIPTLDAGPEFERTLAAVREQRAPANVQLLVCDSGSRDHTVSLARGYGAELIEIDRRTFSHGGTRNLMMRRAEGEYVAFLTQDAEPADPRWLTRLLDSFRLAPDVGLVFGPYRPRPDASPMVAGELTRWFEALSPNGEPRIDRLSSAERDVPARDLLGARGFFTDANGCMARKAWEMVPFRDVGYAEDQLLACDMLRTGFAKVFSPDAAVLHSHEYSSLGWLRRSFDESRGLRDVYGWVEPVDPRTVALNLYGRVGADLRWARRHGYSGSRALALVGESTVHHGARQVGAMLGARSERLPIKLAGWLSLEGQRRR